MTSLHAIQSAIALHKADKEFYLTHSSTGIDFSYACYLDRNKSFRKCIDDVCDAVELKKSKPTRYHVQLLLLNLLRCIKHQPVQALATPSSNDAIKTYLQRHKNLPDEFGYKWLDVLQAFVKHDLLIPISSYEKNNRDNGALRGKETKDRQWLYNRYLPTEKLWQEWIAEYNLLNVKAHRVKSYPFIRVYREREDETNKRTEMPLDAFTARKEQEVKTKTRQFLHKYNNLIESTTITLSQGQPPAARQDTFRIFSRGSLHYGGRLYGGFWQVLPNPKRAVVPNRSHILVNGEPTVELDFSAYHVNMLYAWEGEEPLKAGDDAYTLAEYENKRDFVKFVVLVSLNAKDKIKQAIEGEIRKEKRKAAKVGDTAKVQELDGYYHMVQQGEHLKVRKLFKAKHPTIAKHIGADVGILLQRQDSDIAMRVIEMMMQHDSVPVLCVHDSFICPARYKEELSMAMKGAFEWVMGTKTSPTVK